MENCFYFEECDFVELKTVSPAVVTTIQLIVRYIGNPVSGLDGSVDNFYSQNTFSQIRHK